MLWLNLTAKDGTDPLLICFMVLIYVGLWTTNSKYSWKNTLYAVYKTLCILSFIIYPVLVLLDIYHSLGNLEIVNYDLCSCISEMGIFVKMFFLAWFQNDIIKFQKTMETNLGLSHVGKSEEDKKILREKDYWSRLFLKSFFMCISTPLGICWTLSSLIDSERRTPLPLWLPFDFLKSPIYEFLFIHNAYMIFMYLGSIVGIGMIFYTSTPKLCGHLQIIKKDLRLLSHGPRGKRVMYTTPQEENAAYEYLTRIVQHHQELLKAIRDFDAAYGKILLVNFFAECVLLTVVIFDIVMVHRTSITTRLATQILYFTGTLTHTFIFCFRGNEFIDEGKETSFEIYNTPWYDMSPRCKKLLHIMLLRSQRYPEMTADRMVPVNLETFLNICNTSYKIFTLLQQMNS